MYMVDLERLLSQSDPQQAAHLWKRDRVHFTTAGSNLLGELFYHAMLNFSYGLWQRGVLRRSEGVENDSSSSSSNISLSSYIQPHSYDRHRHGNSSSSSSSSSSSHYKGTPNYSYVLRNHSNNCSSVVYY